MSKPKKVVVLGQNGCGKTSILNRFIRNHYQENYSATIGAAYASATLQTNDGALVKLDIWDTAGAEVYRAISRLYYRAAKAAIVCYDMTSNESYKDVFYWVDQLTTYEKKCKIYICGTKLDLISMNIKPRQVSVIDVENFVEANGYKSIETSSKLDINIKKLFKIIAEDLSNENEPHDERKHVELNAASEPSKNCKC